MTAIPPVDGLTIGAALWRAAERPPAGEALVLARRDLSSLRTGVVARIPCPIEIMSRLAHLKVPRFVRFVDEIPLTVTGTVQELRIREMAIEEHGLVPGHGSVAYDDKTATDRDTAEGAGSAR